MSSYEMMRQDLPAYGQSSAPGYQQQVVPPSYATGTHPANQSLASRWLRRNDEENDTAAADEVLGPGDIPDEALNLDFNKCFYEHKSTKSFDQLNVCLGITYQFTKLVTYHIFVFLLGIPMLIFWALFNAVVVFILVWIYQPGLRVMIMVTYAWMPLVTVPLQAMLTPLVDASARIFRQIRIKANLEGSFAERLARGNQTQTA